MKKKSATFVSDPDDPKYLFAMNRPARRRAKKLRFANCMAVKGDPWLCYPPKVAGKAQYRVGEEIVEITYMPSRTVRRAKAKRY